MFIRIVFCCFTLSCSLFFQQAYANLEIFDTRLESPYLSVIKQLTFPEMGFEKAGEGYFSPDGRTIIFQAVPVGQKHYQIYTMDLEEGIPRMVSTGKGACTCAFFRPDGKKILFASSHSDPFLDDPNYALSVPGYNRKGEDYKWDFTPYMNIYEADPDGSNLKALTEGPFYHAECAYSPDGLRIVFASNREGSMNIYTMKADGTDRQQVTHTVDCYNGGSFFSPDGTQIIFRADREKPHYLQVFVINADGSDERQLTDNHAVNWAPYWHPNGKVIAFTTSLHGHAHYEIYLLNIFTGASHRLTHHSKFDGLPVFSPDGTKIMWTSKRGPDQTSQLFLANFILPQHLN
ncbi:TolB family protein [Candidatus Protochlamydia phocaeensis]|uniref:TolB family protein n=1 Tax=Candidatus Protochlamydia phocaeensis TaxID=1414722 RepID=UPI000839AAA5|nr:TolB family protein [Candidatus Protochlamydia phocaeensis]